MHKIDLYTHGIQAFIKPVDAGMISEKIESDGFNVHFANESIQMRNAQVMTLITTAYGDDEGSHAIYYSLNESTNLLRSHNPLIHGGDFFKNRKEFGDGQGIMLGAMQNWKDAPGSITIETEAPFNPANLYFSVISLRPFFNQYAIMGAIYGELSDKDREQLLAGEFFDPQGVREMFPHLSVAAIDYDMDMERFKYELYAGIIRNNEQMFLFERLSDSVDVDASAYEKAIESEKEAQH